MQCPITMTVLAIAAAVAAAVMQQQAAKAQAKAAQKSADEKAKVERANAENAATRAAIAASEEKARAKISGLELRGKVNNLQNKSGQQTAALLAQADREEGTNITSIQMRMANTHADVRTAFSNIKANQNATYRANPGPAKGALAISIAGAVAGGGAKIGAHRQAGATS